MKIFHIPAFRDNYIWAVQNGDFISLVDPGDADVSLDIIKSKNLILQDILITHHHYDHTGGVNALKKFMKGTVYGPKDCIFDGIEVPLVENETLKTLGYSFKVLETPGHTLDHICYYNQEDKILFCGDTLFSAGCGRLFEGTYDQMHDSLQKINSLPAETKLFCTHEYTLANLNFALSQINDSEIAKEFKYLESKQGESFISLPTTIKKERKINLFLLEKRIPELSHLCDLDYFSELRQRKDSF